MNIIKRYLEYRKNNKPVIHHEFIIPEREQELGIGALVQEDIKLLGYKEEDLRGEDNEAIKLYRGVKYDK